MQWPAVRINAGPIIVPVQEKFPLRKRPTNQGIGENGEIIPQSKKKEREIEKINILVT